MCAMPVSTPQQLRKDVRGTFIEALMEPREAGFIDSIATVINSESTKEDYGWLGEVAPLEEFVDQVSYGDLTETSGAGMEVENKTYVGGLAFKRDDLADSKTGGQMIRVRDLAQRAVRLPDAQLCQALIDGTSNLGYDGVAFFSASHTARGKQTAVQSNLLTGNGTTTANCATDVGAAIAALYNMVDEGNEPMNEYFREIWIGYPPAMHKAISEATEAGIISNTSNTQFSKHNIQLIQMPRLTSDSTVDYYVGIKDAEVRGLLWQDREGISLEQSGPQSDSWIDLEVAKFKARLRGRAWYARWQRLIKVNNT